MERTLLTLMLHFSLHNVYEKSPREIGMFFFSLDVLEIKSERPDGAGLVMSRGETASIWVEGC